MTSRQYKFQSLIAFLGPFILGVSGLWAQEICGNGVDDDGNGLIDCFDPACCEECEDHYFTDCDANLCETNRPDASSFNSREMWRFSGEWDNINTPLIGTLRDSEGPVIVGISSEEVGLFSRRDILIIEGETGQLLRRIPTPAIPEYATTIGIADVTSDGQGNIIAGLSEDSPFNRHLECYDPDGNLIWRSDQPQGFNSADVHATPLFADFNADGQPEIYVGNMIFDGLTGRRIIAGSIRSHRGAQEARQTGYRFFSPVAADILPDGFCPDCEDLEFIAGGQVHAVDITGETINLAATIDTSMYGDGFTAVSDVNSDGELDIVVAHRNGDELLIYAWDPRMEAILAEFTYINPMNTMFTGGSSAPLLTDLDGDGFIDIVFSTSFFLVALQNNADGSFSVLWDIETQDLSGRSGPVSFDFTGDGRPEIVHRGQENLRIIDGENGDVLGEINCFSSTFFDKAVVANINSGSQAEILVSCGNNLDAFTSQGDPWKSARPVWNQLPFFNTHVADNLSIPSNMQAIHIPETAGERRLNRFLEQYSRPISPGPDFFFDDISVVCENGSKFIEMRVCNDGDLRAPVQVFIAAYADNPLEMLNPPAWNVQEPNFLDPGQCIDLRYVFPPFGNLEEAYFTLNIPPGLPFVDTTDMNSFLTPECRYENNFELVDLSPFLLHPIALGEDTTVCADIADEITLEPDTAYSAYMWSTGAMTDSITVDRSGVYTLSVSDNCGNEGMDSIRVTFQDGGDMGLPSDTSLCPSDSLQLEVDPSFENLVWLDFNGDTLCNQCPVLNIEVLEETTIEVIGFLSDCEVRDSIQLRFLPSVVTSDTLQICPGDSALVNGDWVGPGTYSESFSTPSLCDSVSIIEVEEFEPIEYTVDTEQACQGDSDGRAEVSTPTGNVNIEWFDGNAMFSRNLPAGIYDFDLFDDNSCRHTDSVQIQEIAWQQSGWQVEQINCFAGRDTLPLVPTSSTGRIEARLGADSTFSWFLNGNILADSVYVNDAPSPGEYLFEIRKENCVFTSVLEIFEKQAVQQDPTLDIFIDAGDSVVLGDEFVDQNITNISWVPSTFLNCGDCIPAVGIPEDDIEYVLTAEDADGCEFQKRYRIFLQAGLAIAIPNAFTPNGDGINDFLTISSSEPIQSLDYFRIFDRWGSMLFELRGGSGNEIQLWDGRAQGQRAQPGVYVYSIRLTDGAGQLRDLSGSITLIR